ncbi:putative early transcription factor [Tupanvirus deep ocean]|uniref:Early transcription factor n=2 Tax=Tupanvirus TaxID=2094720 RepID=A0AC62A7T8_9VIRU|nr:putative early transcription factor [Tupanvirus deep ocean]QKU33839.1 putative early transcription factor [Tupanvirus deep ocean]
MDDPIKIIHKYKNNNGRIQYHIHIFLGDIVDENCMRILRKIKDMDLYSALTSFDIREREIIEKNYGEFWYEKFFNSYHINNTKENTLKNPTKMKELRSIYDTKWVNEHFVNYLKRIETIVYNYEYVVKEERERKMIKKIMQKQQHEAEDIVDYTTSGKSKAIVSDYQFDINPARIKKEQTGYNIIGSQDKPFKIIDMKEQQNWCQNEESPEASDNSPKNIFNNRPIKNYTDSEEYSDYETDSYSDDDPFGSDTESEDEVLEVESEEDLIKIQSGGQDEEADIEFEDAGNPEFDFENIESDQAVRDFESEVEKDLEDVDIIFGDLDDADKNIKLTTKEIKEAISNETYEKLNKKISEFDNSKDNSMFDENLKDVVSKNYITHQYIFKDDTIKTIHNKICCGFKNNNKFGDNTYIIPSYQYIWSEYQYQGKIEKIMIGQKWIVKNDILKLDVEPNSNLGVYEDLRGNLKVLRDNIRRQGKIKREDDDNSILFDYQGFFTYNELYMIDIYNELGLDYDPNFEELKNLIDVYMRIYFPKIRTDDIRNIIDFLSRNVADSKKTTERNKLKTIFDTINNDLILENEIMRDIEIVKKKNTKEYTKIFQENFVTQSVIRAYLLDRYKKVDLFRIFDNFMLDADYPFIQYQPTDGTPRYRYSEKYLIENERKEIIMKWFENSPYGISFKVRVNEKSDYKYMAINLSDNGRIDYKIQWKEEDMSTVDDISQTYQYIRKLVEKINNENEKYHIKLNIPTDDDFKFAFINTIQKFELPNNFAINHNDLSEFSRYFFPYIALVIEPRKRQSKLKKGDRNEKSKFGTYLRYKRVSKYENRTKIEHRIIFFMRNYEYDDQSLANEISKEFNITEEQAFEEIENVREKYPNIKKSRKILKKLENIPKYKPPGIGVDIQGKSRNKYKMRIAGARDREQLDRIITFMNVLIYLYVETYLYKKPDRQKMKDRLKRLTKIARRRNKVDEIVNHETAIKTVKQMTSIDRKRLSYKAEEDQNQWTRNCQNSGEDKKRRPQQFLNVEELQKLGYVWNDTLDGFQFGHYERKVMVDADGRTDSNKKKKEVTLRAVKLPLDETGENFVYYTCGPEENGKHMYIGFLNKSKNPYGEAMPCCFIKDHLYSKNKEKRNFFLRSIGIMQDEEDANKISGDQLYILQDSNKIQEGRFAFLPKYLDVFMNFMLGNDRKIKNHYLLSTPTGYYFKYGAKQDEFKYLNALSAIFDMTVPQVKDRLIKTLEADKNLAIFTSLNNGDIRTQFGTIEAYISYIRNNEYLEYPLLNDLIGLPGVIRKNGVNIILFQKKLRIIRKSLEREKIKESYYVVCQNPENVNELKNPERETAFIIKESKNYYPIIMVKKEQEQSKDVIITKTFKYNKEPKNIISHIFKYYKINCQSEFHVLIKDKSSGNFNAKETNLLLQEIGKREYQPKVQIIDARYKCKYLITYGGYIIPTIPSGTIYNINITTNIDNYIKDYGTTFKYLNDIFYLTKEKLKLKPIGIYYREKKEKSYVVSAIMTESYDSVPVIERLMTAEYIRKENLYIQNKPNDDMIDREIMKGPDNIVIDNRVYYVSKNKYETELYQLFRFHLSYYLNNIPAGIKYKERLESIINNNKIPKREKKLDVKKLLYQMTSSDLAKTFVELLKKKQLITQRGGQQNEHGYNVLADAKLPVNIVKQKERTVQIIPRDFDVSDKRRRSNLRDLAETPDVEEFDYSEPVPPTTTPFEFTKNEAPSIGNVHFPADEKNWIYIMPESRKIDYPSFILRNNRELCYNNDNKESCNINQHCNWVNSKNMCMLSVKQDLLVDYINQVAEEFIQNELKAHEILRKGEYFVSDIVNYNVFTERPGERIIMTSNTNLNKILSEIFGKENIPRIGKRRNKLESMQNYDQLNIDNPMRDMNNWYIQNIIENNNTIFRAFANAYYWLVHPYNDPVVRNLGYYSALQTNLANIYKSQVIDWLMSPENNDEIINLLPYIKSGRVIEFTTKLSMDVQTLTNCIVELYILSKINETIIYVNDENYSIIYAFHPNNGLVYDFRKQKQTFDISVHKNFKKVINLRFHYISKNISPDKIEVMYPKV